MDLRSLVGVALAVALAAHSGLPGGVFVGGAVLVLTILTVRVLDGRPTTGDRSARHRSVVGWGLSVLLVLVVAHRADTGRADLDRPLPEGPVEGVAWVVGDPVRTDLGFRTVLRLQGVRYWTIVPDFAGTGAGGLLVGDRVWVRGRAAPFDGARDSWRWSRHLAGVLRVEELRPGPPAPVWVSLPNAIRRLLVAGAEGLDEDRRALYLGLVIGDDREQDDLDRFRFRVSGLGHLLVVSGQNVALVLAAAAPALLRLPRRLRPVVGAAVVACFVVVTRAEPSVLRAAVMAVVVLLATAEGRVAGGVRALAWSVVVLVVIDPLLVHSLGFLLSVVATLGLSVGSSPVAARLRGPRWWRELVGASVAAQLATTPVQVLAFGVVPAVSLPANLLAVPVAGVVVVLGATVGLLAGALHPVVAGPLVVPIGLLVGWIDGVATASSRLPVAPLGPVGACIAVVAAGLVWSSWRTGGPVGRCGGVALGLVVLVALLLPSQPAPGRHRLAAAAVLDVSPGGRRVVGIAPGARTLDVLDSLWRLGVDRVDLIAGPDGSPAVSAVAEQFGPGRGAAR